MTGSQIPEESLYGNILNENYSYSRRALNIPSTTIQISIKS